jgi:hypothetical protein
MVTNLPGNWVGSVRIESQEWWTPGDPKVLGPNIVGVASLIRYTDVSRTTATEAIAYNLLPEQWAYDWQIGENGGGTDSGIGLIAVPSLLKDLKTTGVSTELAIANLVPKPGFTDFAIYIYDQNGLLDFVCEKLNEKQVEYIDLNTWGYINEGFKGSAIISAVFWEHDVFDGGGFFLRNVVGLAAVIVERTGGVLADRDMIPGDESGGTTAFPIAQPFHFQGPQAPRCPGQPPPVTGGGDAGPTCTEPDFGAEVTSGWSTDTAPVPLMFTAGVCAPSGTPQTFALESPDVPWDGEDDVILTFQNCGTEEQDITFFTNRATCPGGLPFGELIVVYQADDGSPDPFDPGNVCNNFLVPDVGIPFGGFCEDGPCTYHVIPGEYQVLIQTNLIGGTCTPGVEYIIDQP